MLAVAQHSATAINNELLRIAKDAAVSLASDEHHELVP